MNTEPEFASFRGFKKARVVNRPRLTVQASATARFYAEDAKDFASLGVNEALCNALSHAGLNMPSKIQVSQCHLFMQMHGHIAILPWHAVN